VKILTTVLLIIIAVLLFGFIIFIHEYGHFFTAKLCGIRVNEFSLGMGPKLWSFKKGETQYSLRAFPIGGYCAMEGEDEDSPDQKAFSNKPVWKRMIVVVAGALMNILLGIILMAVILCQQSLLGTNQIAGFSDGSVLEAAGAQTGDYIVSIDNYTVRTDKDLSFALALANSSTADVIIQRDNQTIDLGNVSFNTNNSSDGKSSIVVDFYIYGVEKNFFNVVGKSFADTYSVVRLVFASLGGLLTGKFTFNDLSGPVGAAQAITQAASVGLQVSFMSAVNNIIMMMVVISVNLGIFNLLPFPALDGGRFFMLIIEGIRKKPLAKKYESYINYVGFAVLILLMIAITAKDIYKLFT
jgi:regulator of sigma E protease